MASFYGTFSGRSNHRLDFHISQGTQSLAGNYTNVVWSLYVVRTSGTGSYSFDVVGSAAVNLSGHTWSRGGWSYDFRSNSTLLLGSGSFNIGHNSAGYLTVSASASANSASTLGSASASGSVGITRIAKAPSAPRTLTATAHVSEGGRIDLAWLAPTDDGGSAITSYSIYVDGVLEDTSATTAYSVTGLTPGTSYSFYVRANNGVTTALGTQSPNSNEVTKVAEGLPSEPLNLVTTASTSVFGRVDLAWDAPTSLAGGITGYNVYRDGALIAQPTGTTYAATGLTTAQSYSFTVRARNAFADSTSTAGPASSASVAVAPGPPSAPLNLTAIASESVAGLIHLDWDTPTTTSGTITGYNIYRSTGDLLYVLTGTDTSYDADDLTPGTTYGFYVRARNAITDVVGTYSANSNVVYETAIGSPDAPTNLVVTPSPIVARRLVLTWDEPAGGVTSYNVYRAGVFIGATSTETFSEDFLVPGVSYSYTVAARNPVTDLDNVTGPHSTPASGTPTSTSSQAVPSISVSNATNTVLSGTYTLGALTLATAITYSKSASAIPLATVPAGAGTVTDDTNTALSGAKTIVSAPTTTSLTYADAGTNLTVAPVISGTIADDTNIDVFNGTYVVSDIDGPNSTVSYVRVSDDVSSRASGGTGMIINNTNIIFNGEDFTVVGVPSETEIIYDVDNGGVDIAETTASGFVYDITNIEVFNGVVTVVETPQYNQFTYAPGGSSDLLVEEVSIESTGEVNQVDSKAVLRVKYRSGWLG